MSTLTRPSARSLPAGGRDVSSAGVPARPAAWLGRAAGPVLLAATFVGLCAGTWRRWPDPMVDFGRELYLAWRIAEGDVLYRDLAHFNGPLSVYFNGALFRVFGESLTTLIWSNLLLTALLTGLIYHAVAKWCDRMTATLAGLVFLTVCAFGQFSHVGNYNFICPYSHEITHGAFLCVLMLLLLGRVVTRGGRAWELSAAGVCFGLIFLTKPEVFLAATVAVGWTALLVASRRLVGQASPLVPDSSLTDKRGRLSYERRAALANAIGRSILAGALFAGGAVIPVLAFFAGLSGRMPAGDALRGIVGAWPAILRGRLANNAFYDQVLGTDDLAGNLIVNLWSAGFVLTLAGCVVLLHLAAAGARRPGAPESRSGLCLLGGMALMTSVWALSEPPRLVVGPSLPLLMALVCGYATYRACRTAAASPERWQLLSLWSAFALVFMAKCLLKVRVFHYGFALAMPAMLVLVIVLCAVLRRAAPAGRLGPLLIGTLLVCDCLFYGDVTLERCAGKTVAIGSPADRILAYPPEALNPASKELRMTRPGPTVARMIASVEEHVPSDGTLLVLPEGVTINYLTRRRNPTPYVNFMPPELQIFGEPQIFAAMHEARPDFVLLLDRTTAEHGYPYFGSDPAYGRRILEWVRANYEPVERLTDPRADCPFGVVLLRRRGS